jgi:hypothetical protein
MAIHFLCFLQIYILYTSDIQHYRLPAITPKLDRRASTESLKQHRRPSPGLSFLPNNLER